jgi:hypothetical protein
MVGVPAGQVNGDPQALATVLAPSLEIDCGADMAVLMRVDGCEWDGGSGSRCPQEDQPFEAGHRELQALFHDA